jgi:hypothetical protein
MRFILGMVRYDNDTIVASQGLRSERNRLGLEMVFSRLWRLGYIGVIVVHLRPPVIEKLDDFQGR